MKFSIKNFFSKCDQICSFLRIWSHLLQKSLTENFIFCALIFRHIHILFRHIQPYCYIYRTLCNSCIFRTWPYPESWHIQNPRYIQNSIKAYSGIYIQTLCNARILRTLPYLGPEAYSESSLFRHIQAYSGIFNNDTYNNINFLFSL